MSERQSPSASTTRRAAVGAIIGGPVGTVTALATGGPLVLLAGVFVAAGALIGALTAEDEDEPREAAIDAVLPIGVWLVGAAVGWVILATQQEHLPVLLREYPSEAALGAGVLGGTLAVFVLMVRLAR